VGEAALELGEALVGFYSAGLPGPKGNRETFVWLAEGQRAGATREGARVRELAAAAEPSRDPTPSPTDHQPQAVKGRREQTRAERRRSVRRSA
jgi:hypothetical protein